MTTALVTTAVATAVSGLFAVTLLRRWWDRGRRSGALLVWGVALLMFCTASAALLSGVVGGWTSAEFRVFYLFGAVLNVPWLALGSIVVNAERRAVSRWTGLLLVVLAAVLARQVAVADDPVLWVPAAAFAVTWGLILLIGIRRVVVAGAAVVLVAYSVAASILVVEAAYVAPLPRTGLPEGAELFAPLVRGFAIGANIVGAITVVVSALVSSAAIVWRRPDQTANARIVADTREHGWVGAVARWIFRGRTGHGIALAHLVRGNLMIALGVAIAAAGGVFSFLGDTAGHAVGFTLGVTVMYAGFVRTTRPRDIPPAGVADTAGRTPDDR